MSLSTVGGGGLGGGAGASGGLVMAHQANAVARPVQPNAPPDAGIPPGSAPPASVAALGADLVDKQQELSLRQVRDLSKYPLVAVDLYATEPCVSSFPPKSDDPAARNVAEVLGKIKTNVYLKPGESSNRTFRKFLSLTKDYGDMRNDTLSTSDDKSAVVIADPHRWLGLRRLSDAPDYLRKQVQEDDSVTPAIAEESSLGVGVVMTNGTLDGSTPQGDDFDRVIAKVRLHETKKALTVLPEEAVQLVLNQAQFHTAKSLKQADDPEEYVQYPCSIAIPAAYCCDAVVEAMMDATNGTGVIFQRSVCAMAGALIPASQGKHNALVEHLNEVMKAMHKEYLKEKVKNPDAQFEEEVTVIIAGVTGDTAECTAIQLSSSQPDNISCIYGNFRVMTTVSYKTDDPMTTVELCIRDVHKNLDVLFPEADGPVGFVVYGTSEEQKKIEERWYSIRSKMEDWERVNCFTTPPASVAYGTAVLGAVNHGRLYEITQVQGKKPKAQLAIRVQNVAPVALGVQMNYHGGHSGKWMPVKTVFDFDRRVPAGPFAIDLNAAECAVYRAGKTDLSEEDLLKAIKENEGSKHIPVREVAAMNLRVRIMQKLTREAEWKPVGNVLSPLVDVDRDENKTACERVSLELSMGSTGLISHAFAGVRESVVQAVKSARKSALQWYIGVFLTVAFFGGFLLKSYWEEHVFQRDTRRLLAYYKHVIPGSIADGDEHNAKYLVWKYRNKKDKLWKSLEKKYGHPVLQVDEWEDENDDPVAGETESEEDETDLDDEKEQDL